MKSSRLLSVLVLCSSVFSVSTAFAHKAPLRTDEMVISCLTGHGVTVEAERSREVKTSWGLSETTFRLIAAYTESTRMGMMTHLQLYPMDSQASRYDIILWGQPQPFAKSLHYGQIGVYMDKYRGKKMDQVGFLGFMPISTITCTIDQER